MSLYQNVDPGLKLTFHAKIRIQDKNEKKKAFNEIIIGKTWLKKNMEKNVEVIHEKTVIIGAGMSVIAAAVNLLSNNYDQFVIYESLEVGLW